MTFAGSAPRPRLAASTDLGGRPASALAGALPIEAADVPSPSPEERPFAESAGTAPGRRSEHGLPPACAELTIADDIDIGVPLRAHPVTRPATGGAAEVRAGHRSRIPYQLIAITPELAATLDKHSPASSPEAVDPGGQSHAPHNHTPATPR